MTAVLEVQGREQTAFCGPILSFSKVARQVGMKDKDGPRPPVPYRPGLLGVPRRAPRGPGLLRTLSTTAEHCLSYLNSE